MTKSLAPALTRRLLLVSGGNIFVAGCVISGCGSLLPAPMSLPIYLLEPSFAEPPATSRVDWQLIVALPRAQTSLDTARIALRKAPPMLDYYANAAWPDRLPVLIQGLLVETFVRSGRIVGVARDDSGISANYRLETELLDFETHYGVAGNPPDVVVQLEASLISLPTRTITARTTVMERVATTNNNLSDIIKSFDRATALTLERIAAWTFRELPG